jgi:isoaspartyl peptidase/L-asparaginase-like protein (Ntn-hydrolase superfamily)
VTLRFPPEVRFAKHRLLLEIGPAGQARLSASRFSIDVADPAARFAADLLERSGLTQAADAPPVTIATSAQPDEAFLEADAAVRGAIAAVERVRAIVDAGGAPLSLTPRVR